MASGIFAIFDDIAALMDDVAMASKIATRKTAGILGDDLAVNAEKATGFLESRELPVLWQITKGSFINKLIIVPIALLLNAYFSVIIQYILIAGGLFLAYEGVEKIIEFIFHREKKGEEVIQKVAEEGVDAEKAKIKSAIMTDFILSVEIVIIALNSAITSSDDFMTQVLTVSVVAIIATVGVYGIVALIVRMDDLGYRLIKRSNDKGVVSKLGHGLVKSLPIVIKVLAVVGTIALLLVSGGIFSHNIDYFHHLFPQIPSMLKEFALGLIMGLAVVAVVTLIKKMLPSKKTT
ncbi:DUF808 domain-containing protein [Sphingobacterium hungaricum]|uniref:DUF808 domain-containing protein n=1 Tax=Sphingobacterium hungaricum TaxID=2082723 RepID=A0A928V117_9SPHI|nr:DUF808 domain-containing protein [Sphingobacterium hungaricum]MBE8715160.1 DUF808 domain-containing protein [Sphingobacterium hungaricum]